MLETIIIEPSSPPTHALIWLHGLGADGHDFEPIMPQIQPKKGSAIRFILPHAPVRAVSLFGGMPARAWFDISLATRNNDYRFESREVAAMAAQLEQIIDAQITAGIPAKNILLAGFSQGGAMAIYTALSSNKTMGGVIGLSTFLPVANELAAKTAHRFPAFIAHGTQDEVVPYSAGVALSIAMKQTGFEVTWKSYSIGHSVSPEEVLDILTWLENTLSF